jgi:hypothetical protein
MGILNDLWWLSGFVLAAPLFVVGVDYLGQNEPVWGGFFLLIAVAALALPEYVRHTLFGGDERFLATVPGIGRLFE